MKVSFNTDYKNYNNSAFLAHKSQYCAPKRQVSLNNIESDFREINQIYSYPIAFSGSIFDEPDDTYFFNNPDADLFSIKLFNQLYDNLHKYKINLEPELSVYLTDNQTAKKLESENNITLVNNASAQNVKGLFIDMNGNTRVKNAEAIKNFYMFDDSACNTVKADRIFLSDRTNSIDNTGRIVWIKDSACANNIKADSVFQRNYASVGESSSRNFYTRDNSISQNVHSANIIMKDNAYIEYAQSTSGDVNLQDNSYIKCLEVDSSNITLGKNAKIDKIISEGNVDITGNGTVKDIEVKGSHAFIRGNIKLEGNIRFLNNEGVVIVQKGAQNIFPKIDSTMVDNGLLQFFIQNSKNTYLGNPVDTFSSGIKLLTDSVDNYTEQNTPAFNDTEIHLPDTFDVEDKNLYSDFFHSYIQSFTLSDDSKTFSLSWIKNAKLGDKNFADLCISMLGKNPDKIADTQKTYMLNNLSSKEKSHLTRALSEYWIKNVLPVQKMEIHFNDLDTIKDDEMFVRKVLSVIKDSPEDFVLRLDNKDFFDKLLSLELGQSKLIDFWFNAVKIQGAEHQTDRLRKECLKNIVKNPDFVNVLLTSTENLLDKQSKCLEQFKSACEDLLNNEPDIDKLQKKLLNKYKNSRVLYNIIALRTGSSGSVSRIESEIVEILRNLALERNTLAVKARKDIFDKTLNVQNVVTAKPNTQLNNFVNFVFNTLAQSTKSLDKEDVDDFSDRIFAFNNYVNKKSYYFGPLWQEFVKSAYSYYNEVLLDKITDNNLNLLYSIEKSSSNGINNKLKKIIKGASLDKIEQKDFAMRYRDNYNFQILMANDGINHKEVLSELLFAEALNEHMYQMRLDNLPQVFDNESVKTNLDIIDKYLQIQDKDYPSMSIREKTNAVLKIPAEELSYMNKLIMQDWKENELQSLMSDKFIQVQMMNNINAQSKSIVSSLEKINNNLDNIRINVAGQYFTINEMAANIDKLVDIQRKSFKELYFIGENVEAINHSTESIRDNTRAILYSAMQNAKIRDPELSKMISELIPETERNSFTEFLSVVEKKYNAIKDEKKKQQMQTLATLATVAAACAGFGGISPDSIATLLGGSDTALKFSNGVISVVDTLKHVAIFKAATTGIQKV